TRDRFAALFAGGTFGASPFLLVRLQGHLNVLSAWGLPLLVVAVLRYEQNPRWTTAALLAAVLAVLAYTDYYFAIFGTIVTSLHLVQTGWTVTYGESAFRGIRRDRVFVILLVLIAAACAAIAWIEL